MKQVSYSRETIKTLDRIPQNCARRIREKISQYAADPASEANKVTRSRGAHRLRLRVGNWRVIFDEAGHVILIIEIGPRESVYS